MATEPFYFLEWDSAFFGLRIARLAGSRLNQERAAEAIRWCEANGIDCLYFLSDSNHPETATSAEAAGFQLVDVRLTFERGPLAEAAETPAVRAFQTADGPRLCQIASAAFRDSRFYADGRFPTSRCDALYEVWIERSFSGWANAVFVVEADHEPAGFISCHLGESQVGSIGLVAVAAGQQGRGAGSQLVDAALRYFTQSGMRRVTVVTQARNAASQRLYQRAGFSISQTQWWYHRWFTNECSV